MPTRRGAEWYRKAQDARERGLAPLGVLTLLSREPGAGPVTGATGVDAVKDLARTVTPEDDRRLLDQLDRDNAAAWRELGDAYDALTDEDRTITWGGGRTSARGVTHVPFPRYSEPLKRVVRALSGVGAVTPRAPVGRQPAARTRAGRAAVPGGRRARRHDDRARGALLGRHDRPGGRERPPPRRRHRPPRLVRRTARHRPPACAGSAEVRPPPTSPSTPTGGSWSSSVPGGRTGRCA
ncbi:hypothetical protein GCM10020295_54550 [Streptomyces cinereospinus]